MRKLDRLVGEHFILKRIARNENIMGQQPSYTPGNDAFYQRLITRLNNR